MKKTVLISFTAVILLAGIFTVVQPAAAGVLDPLVPECRGSAGGCNVCDAIGVGINITRIMLGTLGSAALLMFVYGGFLMATSRGHTDQVQKGRDALINAVKGVIIVLGSWVVINYGLAIMLEQKISEPVKILGQDWATVVCNPASADPLCTGKEKGATCGKLDSGGKVINKCNTALKCIKCDDDKCNNVK